VDTPDRILELLYCRGGWWSLDELVRVAGVPRGRVEAALDRLGRAGQALEFSPATGVRLVGPPALNSRLIERELGVRRVGRNVICFDRLDSTNDTAAASARQPNSDGLVVLAESQRKGRGRQGRRWLSEAGTNVLMSVLLVDPDGRSPTEGLTVAAGMAAAEAIEQVLGEAEDVCRLKWPNDVLLDGRKVAGVLVEQRCAPAPCAVIGVGVNVNSHPPDRQVDRPATSLAEHAAGPVDRIVVVRALCRRLDEWLARLTADRAGAVEELRSRWAGRCGMLGNRYTIVSRRRRYTGCVMEIDPLTGLVLRTDEGNHIHIPAEGASVE